MRDWFLLSNHGLALVCVARDPGMTLREIGDCVGVTERTAHAIVKDLCEGGYLCRFQEGNRNRYEVNADIPMRHPMISAHMVGELIDVLKSKPRNDGNSHSGERRNGKAVGRAREAAR